MRHELTTAGASSINKKKVPVFSFYNERKEENEEKLVLFFKRFSEDDVVTVEWNLQVHFLFPIHKVNNRLI